MLISATFSYSSVYTSPGFPGTQALLALIFSLLFLIFLSSETFTAIVADLTFSMASLTFLFPVFPCSYAIDVKAAETELTAFLYAYGSLSAVVVD